MRYNVQEKYSSAGYGERMRKKHTGLKVLMLAVTVIACAFLARGLYCRYRREGANPHSGIWLSREAASALESIERADEYGYFYTFDAYYDYSTFFLREPLRLLAPRLNAGCSAFYCRDEYGTHLTGRNYDLAHLDESGNVTGLNVMVRTAPRNGYSAVAMADARWLYEADSRIRPGCADDGSTDLSLFAFLPWMCMDGINEKGLCVSILAVDIKEGEACTDQNDPGKKEKIPLTFLLRILLDTCADVNEAALTAGQYSIESTAGHDYHLFVTDAKGNSAVLEWRRNKLTVTATDAATNFYLCDEDGADRCENGVLIEAYRKPPETKRAYKMGYGHGYERFCTMITRLDGHRSTADDPAVMSKEQAQSLLEDTFQSYTGELTSFTQYSCLYSAEDRSLTVAPVLGGGAVYTFYVY